ncbi:Meiotic nuclear division protein 1 [Thelohanellus kitauei]|uniref:Meiotic nuclear division protein 1 homolog n=1 Tax=Thelohanellus kitauei TaxID=669202 RepID=A0A0C2MLV4_THEKT|nr:Meiotic nuclear division protein 1 [Thelohanellus kitauei]
MSKKRGLSLEEKRKRMLEIFYEKKEFFQLKELEKIGPKEKGITPMSIKEVVQSLVDDRLVDSDKIGLSTYYWSYPNNAAIARHTQIEVLKKEIQSNTSEIEKIKLLYEKEKAGKQVTQEYEDLLENYENLKQELSVLDESLSKFDHCDTAVYEQMQKHTDELCNAANRWTDNIYALVDYCKNKLFIEKKEVHSYFNIPEELDYI